jgi:hypothetical protein
VNCALTELLAAALPLGTTAVLLAGRTERARALPAVAAAGALAGQAALLLFCPYRTHAHLLVFHLGAVLLAAGIGLVLGRALPHRDAAG